MLKKRPRIRFDGIYVCKTLYVRYGYNETGGQRPGFDVISYKYLKFNENGVVASIYTVHPPKKFIHKLDGSIESLTKLSETGDPKKKGKNAPDAPL